MVVHLYNTTTTTTILLVATNVIVPLVKLGQLNTEKKPTPTILII